MSEFENKDGQQPGYGQGGYDNTPDNEGYGQGSYGADKPKTEAGDGSYRYTGENLSGSTYRYTGAGKNQNRDDGCKHTGGYTYDNARPGAEPDKENDDRGTQQGGSNPGSTGQNRGEYRPGEGSQSYTGGGSYRPGGSSGQSYGSGSYGYDRSNVPPRVNYPYMSEKKTNGLAVAALIVSILGTVCCCCGATAVVFGIVGLVLALVSRKNEEGGKLSGMAIAAIILSGLSIFFGIISAIVGVVVMNDPDFLAAIDGAMSSTTSTGGGALPPNQA